MSIAPCIYRIRGEAEAPGKYLRIIVFSLRTITSFENQTIP
jgi:hypothetical protein